VGQVFGMKTVYKLVVLFLKWKGRVEVELGKDCPIKVFKDLLTL
jgi:hypothetical protein